MTRHNRDSPLYAVFFSLINCFYLTQKSLKSQKFYVLRTLQSHTDHTDLTDFLLSRRNERNKGNFRFTLYAQPVPEALSVISFISAGLEILCAACAGGTFCDFRDFCVPYILCAKTQHSCPRVRSMSIEISIYMFSPVMV